MQIPSLDPKPFEISIEKKGTEENRYVCNKQKRIALQYHITIFIFIDKRINNVNREIVSFSCSVLCLAESCG